MQFSRILSKAFSIMGVVFLSSIILPLLIGVVIFFFINYSGDQEEEDNVKNGVGRIDLLGEISDSTEFTKLITKASHDNKYKALVIRIDSPGGSVGASEEIHRAIKQADALKPVVCSLGNMAASGALYAAVGCRKIVANRGTLSGSIGVIMMTPNFHEIMDKVGFKMTVIKSGPLKDAGSPFRENTEADRQAMQSLVDKAYAQFIDVVSSSRGLDLEVVKKFADGRIIIGEDAKQLGIVDEFGGVQEAAQLAYAATGGIGEPQIIPVKKKDPMMDMLEQLHLSAILPALKHYSSSQLLYQAEL